MTGEMQRWVDPAMFKAEPVESEGPRVYLLEMTSDPLGSIAALSAMYTGKVTRSKNDVTDEERAHHLREMQLTKLTTPLEAVKLHFMLEGVTRAFTHQLVRNRTSAFAQESMRFAVKEDMPVALPPSLFGTTTEAEIVKEWVNLGIMLPGVDFNPVYPCISDDDIQRLPEKQRMRIMWDRQVQGIRETYNALVNMGMPAEDARGLAPTNVQTRINYVTDLRTLLGVLDVRLCTQAQFEWRAVATQMATAIADGYKMDRRWLLAHERCGGRTYGHETEASIMKQVEAEYLAIARLFKPICYRTGKCEFKSDADRACTIRDRVEANHSIGRPSSEWDSPTTTSTGRTTYIEAIHTHEWLMDPGAAR